MPCELLQFEVNASYSLKAGTSELFSETTKQGFLASAVHKASVTIIRLGFRQGNKGMLLRIKIPIKNARN